jgi:ABC-type transport system involved in multi-copper enzyme maturation permease subunit
MLKAIIQREILEYLMSSKFLIGLGLTVVLVCMSTSINIGDYQQRQQDYLDAINNFETLNKNDVLIFRKPQVLSTLVQGEDRELGSRIKINISKLPIQTSGYMGYISQHHRYVSGFTSVDFAFVVRVVLSLMVIFLAYNSIAEERVQGTLRLTLANSLSRGHMLLGKFLGGLFVVLALLTIATFVAVLVLVLHPAISVSWDMSLRILAMWTISALYLGAFFTLSLMISTIFNRPSIALLVLLQIWIILIVVYPNVGNIASQYVVKLPSHEELRDRKRAIFEPYERQYNEAQEALNKSIKEPTYTSEHIQKKFEAEAHRTELLNCVDNEYSQQLTHQVRLAQNIAILSPSVLFSGVMQRLAGTDIREFDSFMEGVKRHWHKSSERYILQFSDHEAYDKSELPEFTYNVQIAVECIAQTLHQWIILFLLSVIFFVTAHMVFIKKNIE